MLYGIFPKDLLFADFLLINHVKQSHSANSHSIALHPAISSNLGLKFIVLFSRCKNIE